MMGIDFQAPAISAEANHMSPNTEDTLDGRRNTVHRMPSL